MHYGFKGLIYLLFTYIILTASTCVETINPGPTVEDFTKQKRESFGDLLKAVIEQSPETYPLLNSQSKGDSVITTYLQTLYNQATQEIRQDRQSTPSNKWNANREWEVVVLDENRRYAFSLPGGHFYISTGFLRSLSKGYEIYYLMALEAVSIANDYLIEDLVDEYSTIGLLDILDAEETSDNPSLLDIADFIKNSHAFQDDIIRELDREAGELICSTSVFDRFGIQPILEILESSSNEQYRDSRPSYSNRVEYINELSIEGCGNVKSTGLYERMVLDNLPN